jgi:plasmid stabilization system protein ParE
MSSFTLTRAARRDLDEIWDYVARYSENQADKLIDWLTSKLETLADNPHLGGEWRPGSSLRAFSAKRYTIFYTPVAGGVEIRRVIPAGPDLDALDLD